MRHRPGRPSGLIGCPFPKHSPLYLKRDGVSTWAHRLIVVRYPLTGETTYLVSNAAPQVRLEEILRVAFTRRRIKRCFEDQK